MTTLRIDVDVTPIRGGGACGGAGYNGAVSFPVTTSVGCGGSSPYAVETGRVFNVLLGESCSNYLFEPDKSTVGAGTVTFAVTNLGELFH